MATNELNTRRGLLKALPSGLMTALLAGNAAEASEIVLVDALNTNEAILRHARELWGLLQKSAPEGAWVRHVYMGGVGGEIVQDAITASAITEDHRLAHARPGVFEGWRSEGRAV